MRLFSVSYNRRVKSYWPLDVLVLVNQQEELSVNKGCSLEDLPGVMNDTH